MMDLGVIGSYTRTARTHVDPEATVGRGRPRDSGIRYGILRSGEKRKDAREWDAY